MTPGLRRMLIFALLLMLPAAAPAVPVSVSVDFNANRRPISPLIFGVSFGDAARNATIGYPLVRWGGNSTSRYNWKGPAHNAGADYFFLGYGSDQSDDADAFIASAASAGAQALLTVPTIGWVEKFDPAHPSDVHWGFSQSKYGAQTLDECRFYDPNPPFWCHADAGNGACDAGNATAFCVNGVIAGNDVSDTSIANAPADDAGWIAHLQSTFGSAAAGGVKLFALDNEIMLWNSTHRDVHPVPLSYAGGWTQTHDYAAAIKQQEPDALVTGPVTWGYSDLWTSAADAASCDCLDGSDRSAHGHLPFVAWYLQQVCANPLAGGKRAVDYLDLHYYPQGTNVALSDDDSATTAALRLRSLKELHDPLWTSESWIGTLDGPAGDDPAWHYTKPALIPRVRAWIDQYCPGTKFAITEYNWGNDGTSSGAVAQAELFGIFAREGVDLAARWVAPAASSKVENAFRLFLDYDGAGGAVRGDSVHATSANADQVGAYAFRDYGRRNLVLLTNKDTSSHSVTLTFASGQSGSWSWYEFDGGNALHQLAGGSVPAPGTDLGSAIALPPMSASLIVLSDHDGLFRDGFD